MMTHSLAVFAIAGAAWLTGCAVYVPTVPATPLLEKGQVEVTAGLRGFSTTELGVAWSPVPHVLVTGELAGNIGSSSTTTTSQQGVKTTYNDSHRQGSVGAGLYRKPTADSYLAVLGGIGWGRTNLFASEDFKAASPFFPFPIPTRSGVYDAQYRRYYGQFYFAAPAFGKDLKGGFSLRTVFVDYTRLNFADQPIAPSNRFFLEPTAFVRTDHGPLRFYLTGGFSAPLSSDRANPANKRTASWSYLFSGGVILRPDLLVRARK